MTKWDLAFLAAVPAVAPAMLWKRMRHGKYRDSVPGMFGRGWPDAPLAGDPPRVWLHSVSVGETVASGAIYRELRAQRPAWEILSTTTTETGQAQAHKSLPDARHAYAPADLSWVVGRFLDRWRPSAFVLLESELWPNRLAACRARGIPAYLANGKLSERSARRYMALRALFLPVFENIRLFLMQGDVYAERMARFLGSDARVRVTGNVKFDALPAPLDAAERAALRTQWGVADGETLVIAGSTHDTEESLIVEAWRRARATAPGLRLLVAPRHPERFDAVAEFLRRAPEGVHRLSTGPAPRDAKPILLLDQMRVLARAYGGGDIALLAGTWKPVGGHNVLEASIHGIPALYGPHMHAQPDIARILAEANADGTTPGDRLAERMAALAANVEERRELGRRARVAAEAQRGAARRTVGMLLGEVEGSARGCSRARSTSRAPGNPASTSAASVTPSPSP